MEIAIRKNVTIEQGIEKIYLVGEVSVGNLSGRGTARR